jgi:hypothetical protein
MKTMIDTDFETLILLEITKAFEKRRKALKHKTKVFSITNLKSSGSENDFQEVLLVELSIDLNFGVTNDQPTLKIKVWPDRWVSVVAFGRSRTSSGWSSEFGGRMSADLTPVMFENKIEDFWDEVTVGRYRSTSDATKYWENILISGPTGVVR